MTTFSLRSLFLFTICCIGYVGSGCRAESACGHTILINSMNTAWDMHRILEKLSAGDIEGARKSAESTRGADDSTLEIMTQGQPTESIGGGENCSGRMIEDTKQHQKQMRSIIESLVHNDSEDAKKTAEESFDAAMQLVQSYPRAEMTPREAKIVDNLLSYVARKKVR